MARLTRPLGMFSDLMNPEPEAQAFFHYHLIKQIVPLVLDLLSTAE
jgi:hypothetical protein